MLLLPVPVCVEGSTTVVDAVEGESAKALGAIPGGRLFVLPLCVEEVSRRANPEISSSRWCPFGDLVASGWIGSREVVIVGGEVGIVEGGGGR